MMKLEKPHRSALFLLIVIAFVWRLRSLDYQSLWRDEIDAIYFSIQPLDGLLQMLLSPGHNGPFYYFLLRPWLNAVGVSDFSARYLSVLVGTISVALLWQVTKAILFRLERQLVNQTAVLAALLLAFNPYQLWYSQEAKMYAIVVALTLSSTWCFLLAMKHGKRRYFALYVLMTSLCIYFHVLAALIIPLHFIWFLLLWSQYKQRWRAYGLSLLCLTVPYLPLIGWQWDTLTSPDYTAGYPFTTLPEMSSQLLALHSRGVLSLGNPLWLIPVYLLWLGGLTVGKFTWRSRWLLISWLVCPIFFLYLISLVVPLYVDRYLIWLAPAYMITISLGVIGLPSLINVQAKKLVFLLLVPLLTLWLYAGWLQTTVPIKADLRQAVAYTLAQRDPADLLILQIPHMHYSYRYYSAGESNEPFLDSARRLAPWMPGLYTNDYPSEAVAWDEVKREMEATTIGYEGAWAIFSETELWDDRRLLNRWLDENGSLEQQADFRIAEVRYYRFR
ncbi:MAG: glycosyltransferase family 39 protein [Chloroflexota bacterium]